MAVCAQSLDPLIWREMQISPALTSLPSLSIYNFTFDLILEIDTWAMLHRKLSPKLLMFPNCLHIGSNIQFALVCEHI